MRNEIYVNVEPDWRDTFHGNTALHIAARKGDHRRVTEIFDENRHLAQVPNKFGETALIIACKYGHKQIVNQLLGAYDYTTEAQKAYVGGETSLLYAAVQGGCLDNVKAILNHRAWHDDLMTKEDKSGRCAIHVAAIKGRWDIISEFISKKPSCIDIRSSDYKSVLHFAVEYNRIQIVRNLLEKEGVLKLLVAGDHDQHHNAALNPEEIKEAADRVKQLVSGDHDQHQNTALHLAALNGVDPELLDLLLCSNVDRNALNREGMTPLSDMMNALNDEGMTALDSASVAAKDNPDCVKIVEKLKEAGVKSSRRVRQSITISDDIVNTHMVVASLIATVTFAAMFQVPGGIEDDKNSIQYGAAKLAFHKLFKLFIFSNTLAFATSLTVVVTWLLRQRLQDTNLWSFFQRVLPQTSEMNLVVSIIWTIVAFMSATIIAIIPHDYENLKSKDKEAFSKYKSFWQYEISIVIIAPHLAGAMFLTISHGLFSEHSKLLGIFRKFSFMGFLNRISSMSTGSFRHTLAQAKVIIIEIDKRVQVFSVLVANLLVTMVFILCFTFK